MITVQIVDAARAQPFAHLVYPALRFPLIDPSGKDLVIATASDDDQEPIGLAFGWGGPNAEFELMSIYVIPFCRRQGIGARLLATVEHGFAAKGYRLGVTRYSLPEHDQGLARFLMDRGWSFPQVRQLLCKGNPQGFYGTAWGRARLPGKFTLKAWYDLSEEERTTISERSKREPNWYAPDQDPFVYEVGCHAETSVAMLHDGAVVGWVLTHLPDGVESLRWTVSFVAPDLSRAGNIVHLWQEACRRQLESTDLKYMTWGVPASHPRMLNFVKRRMGENLLWIAYACTSVKSMSAASEVEP